MSKSYVTLETYICPICGKEHESGNLLLDTRLRDKFDKYTPTDYAVCDDCQEMIDDDYFALIEVTNSIDNRETLGISDANRTGAILWIKKEVAEDIFNVDIEDFNFAFVDKEVIKLLKDMQGETENG